MLGFNIGTPDGEMGPKTQAALTQVQQAMGITAQAPLTRQFLLDLRQQLRAKLPEILAQSKTPDVATLRRTLVGKTAFLHFYHRPWPREERLLRYHATDGRVYQYIPLEKYSASYVYTFEPGTTCLTSDSGIKQCVGVRMYRETMLVLGKDGAVIAIYSMIKEGDIGEAMTFHAVQSREAAENMAKMKAILRFAWEMVVAEERAKAKSRLSPSHPCSGIEETHMGTKCLLTHSR